MDRKVVQALSLFSFFFFYHPTSELPAYLSIYRSIYLPICLPTYPFDYPSIFPSTYVSTPGHLSIYHLSTHLFIYLQTYLAI